MSDDAFTSECVREAGGASKAVTIEQEDLNRDGKPEFFVMGKSCGLGPRRVDAWYYRKVANGYEQILDVNQMEDISSTLSILKFSKVNKGLIFQLCG